MDYYSKKKRTSNLFEILQIILRKPHRAGSRAVLPIIRDRQFNRGFIVGFSSPTKP
jgi:hypothetical protein